MVSGRDDTPSALDSQRSAECVAWSSRCTPLHSRSDRYKYPNGRIFTPPFSSEIRCSTSPRRVTKVLCCLDDRLQLGLGVLDALLLTDDDHGYLSSSFIPAGIEEKKGILVNKTSLGILVKFVKKGIHRTRHRTRYLKPRETFETGLYIFVNKLVKLSTYQSQTANLYHQEAKRSLYTMVLLICLAIDEPSKACLQKLIEMLRK